jgi:hypothetical protein
MTAAVRLDVLESAIGFCQRLERQQAQGRRSRRLERVAPGVQLVALAQQRRGLLVDRAREMRRHSAQLSALELRQRVSAIDAMVDQLDDQLDALMVDLAIPDSDEQSEDVGPSALVDHPQVTGAAGWQKVLADRQREVCDQTCDPELARWCKQNGIGRGVSPQHAAWMRVNA